MREQMEARIKSLEDEVQNAQQQVIIWTQSHHELRGRLAELTEVHAAMFPPSPALELVSDEEEGDAHDTPA